MFLDEETKENDILKIILEKKYLPTSPSVY